MPPKGSGAIRDVNSTARRLVCEVRRQPSLDPLDRLALSACIACDLIFTEAPDREVPRLAVREIESADAGRRRHRSVICECDADVRGAEQRKQLELLAVIRTRRISEGGADAAMRFMQHVGGGPGIVDAEVQARTLMQVCRECFSKAVSERYDDDRVVGVVIALEPVREVDRAKTRGHGK